MMRLASVSIRAGVDPDVAHAALLKATVVQSINSTQEYADRLRENRSAPWATVVEVENQQYVVGQGSKFPDLFVVFPFPFPGHSDCWKVVLPINSAEDLLRQLGK